MRRWKIVFAVGFYLSGVLVACSKGMGKSVSSTALPANEAAVGIKHVIVYRESGRFCGWPANNGAWSWADEILVCFELHYFKEPDPAVDPTEHHVDWDRPGEVVMARSQDGGETWKLERPAAFETGRAKEPAARCPGGTNFMHPDFAMRPRGDRFHISYDRGRSWQGPYSFGDFGMKLNARTDYAVNGPGDCTVILSAEKGPLCVRTTDGGKTFELLGNVCPKTEVKAIMPSTVRISKSRLLSAVRQLRGEPYISWIDVYSSNDNGRSWRFLSKVADADNRYWNGNPPSMVRLRDGRLCVTYGYRAVPYGIRARISSDNGRTWGDEIVLRQDGRNWDLGYTRTVQRKDGKLVTMYYYATQENPEEFLAATIWNPDVVDRDSSARMDIKIMAEHIAGMEESMNQIAKLSQGKVKSVNPLVRWTQIKEAHCDRLRKIVSYDFMSQWIGPSPKTKGRAYKKHVREVGLLQEILYYNFKAKQSNDISNIDKLRSLLSEFQAVYFGRG